MKAIGFLYLKNKLLGEAGDQNLLVLIDRAINDK